MPIERRVLRASPLLIAFALPACGLGESRPGEGVSVRDSSGVTIVENPRLDTVVSVLAAPEPVLEIGQRGGMPGYQLSSVSAAARLGNGSIVVANGETREVRFYGPDGVLAATVGGPLGDARSFGYPSGVVVLPGDTLLVQDGLDRVRIGPDGAFLGRDTLDSGRLAALWGESHSTDGAVWLPGGSLFVPVSLRRPPTPEAGPAFRPATTFVRVDGALTRGDTLGTFGGIYQQYVDAGGTTPRLVVIPFAASTSWATGGPEGAVLVGDNAAPEVHVFRDDGSHLVVRWKAEARRLYPAELGSWKAVQRGAWWTSEQLEELERAWELMDRPRTKPFYGPVALARDGSLWVELAPEPRNEDSGLIPFQVFDAEGRWRGSMTVPGPFTVHDAGPGWVLGIHRNESDTEILRLYQLSG